MVWAISKGYHLVGDSFSPDSDLKLAVVLPTFRRGSYLVRVLESMREQTRRPDEILVIDQTPLNEYTADVESYLGHGSSAGEFQWIRLAEPSVSHARNRAVMETACDILLYLDDDIELSKHLVERHLGHYTDAKVHALVGSVLLPDDREFVPPPLDFLSRAPVVQAFTYRTRFDRALEQVGFLWANNVSIRRTALVAVGGWDEHVINYGDRDLGIRLATSGYRIDYDPEAPIVHLNAPRGGTRVTDPSSPWQGWQRCVSVLYLGFRHLKGRMFLRYGLYRGARFSFLLRRNAIRPWRWPIELIAFGRACFVAHRWARDGLQSPFSPQLPALTARMDRSL
jgi:GT2 family glycosyltransferase